MKPVTKGKYQYSNGYAVYMNKIGQTVDPSTGQTIGPSNPFAHIPLSLMIIADLLADPTSLKAPPIDPRPLSEPNALQEAQVLGLRFDAWTCTLGVLFDLRTALQLREANTGVWISEGVSELTWSGPPPTTSRVAWMVGSSTTEFNAGAFATRLGLWPGPSARQ